MALRARNASPPSCVPKTFHGSPLRTEGKIFQEAFGLWEKAIKNTDFRDHYVALLRHDFSDDDPTEEERTRIKLFFENPPHVLVALPEKNQTYAYGWTYHAAPTFSYLNANFFLKDYDVTPRVHNNHVFLMFVTLAHEAAHSLVHTVPHSSPIDPPNQTKTKKTRESGNFIERRIFGGVVSGLFSPAPVRNQKLRHLCQVQDIMFDNGKNRLKIRREWIEEYLKNGPVPHLKDTDFQKLQPRDKNLVWRRKTDTGNEPEELCMRVKVQQLSEGDADGDASSDSQDGNDSDFSNDNEEETELRVVNVGRDVY